MLVDVEGARIAILSGVNFDWGWLTSELGRFCAHLGWVILHQDENSAILATNFSTGPGDAYLSSNGGVVEQITFKLCGNVLPGDEVGAVEIEDSFHLLARQLTAILGKPREVEEASILNFEWWNSPAPSITLIQANGSIIVKLASSVFRQQEEEWDQLSGEVF